MHIGHGYLCVYVLVCPSPNSHTTARCRMQLGEWYGMPSSCALFGRSAIGYDNIHVCKLIALYTANAYSAERERSVSACTRLMASVHFGALCRLRVAEPYAEVVMAATD